MLLTTVALFAPFNVRVPNEIGVRTPAHALTGFALFVVVVVLARSLLSFLSGAQQGRPDGIDLLAFVWLLAVWLSALVSAGTHHALRLTVAILLVPAARSALRSASDGVQLIRALALGSALAAALGILVFFWTENPLATQVFAGRATYFGTFPRLTRPWSHANVAAMALGATVAGAALVRTRLLRWAALALLVPALVLTVSRGGLVAGAVAGLAWLVLRRDRAAAGAVAVLVLIGVMTFGLSDVWGARVESPGDEFFFASSIEVPASLEITGQPILATITVNNRSGSTWSDVAPEQVLLSGRWIGSDGQVWGEERWKLTESLPPDESLSLDVTVAAPLPDGVYNLRWDLLLLDTAYFGQFLGDDPILTEAQVSESKLTARDVEVYDFVQRPMQIGRVDAWSLAWDDFVASPLLGAGPGQFAKRSADVQARDNLVAGGHSHNLVLEAMGTWGLFGALPFLFLLLGGLARSGRAAWRTRERLPAAVATGLCAVIVHGTVDWPLVAVTTGIPVGVLIAVAWSPAIDQLSPVGTPVSRSSSDGLRCS